MGLVQVTETEDVAFVPAAEYVPKAVAGAEARQEETTVALTLNEAVRVAAWAGFEARADARKHKANIREANFMDYALFVPWLERLNPFIGSTLWSVSDRRNQVFTQVTIPARRSKSNRNAAIPTFLGEKDSKSVTARFFNWKESGKPHPVYTFAQMNDTFRDILIALIFSAAEKPETAQRYFSSSLRIDSSSSRRFAVVLG